MTVYVILPFCHHLVYNMEYRYRNIDTQVHLMPSHKNNEISDHENAVLHCSLVMNIL